MILSGDIGGTKAALALFALEGGTLRELAAETLPVETHPSLEAHIDAFFATHAKWPRTSVESAAFGIAGPVLDQKVVGTNLPWTVEAKALAKHLGLPRATLLNDLEATAYGIGTLDATDLAVLQPGVARKGGNVAVIAAGTGLGEAFATWHDGVLHAHASEGGHGDFAPNTEEQADLWEYLHARFAGHVSWERVASGLGIANVYEFYRDTGRCDEPAWLAEAVHGEDLPAVISAADGKAEIATRTLDLFVEVLAAETGNHALRTMALGGVYLGGGIAPRLESRLTDGRFVRAMTAKGRLSGLVEALPVWLVRNPHTALRGTARAAGSSAIRV